MPGNSNSLPLCSKVTYNFKYLSPPPSEAKNDKGQTYFGPKVMVIDEMRVMTVMMMVMMTIIIIIIIIIII